LGSTFRMLVPDDSRMVALITVASPPVRRLWASSASEGAALPAHATPTRTDRAATDNWLRLIRTSWHRGVPRRRTDRPFGEACRRVAQRGAERREGSGRPSVGGPSNLS